MKQNILNTLVEFSNKYGSNPELVLAGGGNTSAKQNGTLFIKGSGTSLANITASGFVKMEMEKLTLIFEKKYPEEDNIRENLVLKDLNDSKSAGEEEKRPSVETMLHALFKQTYVLHLHPALINGLTCSIGGEAAARSSIKEEFIWVNICKPGYILSVLCKKAMEEFERANGKSANIIILQNHGIFIAANTPEELERILCSVLKQIKAKITEEPSAFVTNGSENLREVIQILRKLNKNDLNPKFITNDNISEFCKSKTAVSPLMKPFTPDHIVYCGAYPLFLKHKHDIEEKFKEYKLSYGNNPRIVLYENEGAIVLGKDEKTQKTAMQLFLDGVKTAVYSRSFGGPLHMTNEMTEFIVNWEVESYRSKQNEKEG